MSTTHIKLNLLTEMQTLIDDLVGLGYANDHCTDFHVETLSIDMTPGSIFTKKLVIYNPEMLKDRRVKEVLVEYLI